MAAGTTAARLVVLIGGTALITNGGLPPADLLPFLLLGLGLTAPVAALIAHSFYDLWKKDATTTCSAAPAATPTSGMPP
ncbi:hypothetical protein [Streptosporangium canum]|uniref:hypothetical protein n=1 Tax=Streptosporangium canum TaxID=324952 RepID=UPI0037B5ABF2